MAEMAARKLNIDLRKSYVVGDKTNDYNLGRVSGMKSFMVRTGQGENYIERLQEIS
jgi:histidinol phosphatase-like enzyme